MNADTHSATLPAAPDRTRRVYCPFCGQELILDRDLFGGGNDLKPAYRGMPLPGGAWCSPELSAFCSLQHWVFYLED